MAGTAVNIDPRNLNIRLGNIAKKSMIPKTKSGTIECPTKTSNKYLNGEIIPCIRFPICFKTHPNACANQTTGLRSNPIAAANV